MKILLKQSIAGEIEGRAGQVIDCHDEAEAQRFIAAGVAELHVDKEATIEELKARIAELEADAKGKAEADAKGKANKKG